MSADSVQKAHGWHVEGKLQGLAYADIALIGHVEIARTVAEEVGRTIFNDCLLRNIALLEGEAVYEGFQRRTRRAQHTRHIHPAGAGGIEIARRADFADDGAGADIGHHDGHGNLGTQPLRCACGGGFEPRLDVAFQRRLVSITPGALRTASSARWAA